MLKKIKAVNRQLILFTACFMRHKYNKNLCVVENKGGKKYLQYIFALSDNTNLYKSWTNKT